MMREILSRPDMVNFVLDSLADLQVRHPLAAARGRSRRQAPPLVDAGMRELAATGFMHNRVRMVVASFLTKDLLLDWRLGERHFMRQLVDGDLASNNGGGQWAASTGTDAQP